jgi:TatD DNase family protein
MMVKKTFDTPLQPHEIAAAEPIINHTVAHGVTTIINVGTSLVESRNCVELAHNYEHCYAVVGIHPNDCTDSWQNDLKEIAQLLRAKEANKIVGIGECGLDFHYPDYNLQRQKDAFRAQIELALQHDLALVVHTRDARDETLKILQEYASDVKRGIIHCFSEDLAFAKQVIAWGYALGIGGAISYPKNDQLRNVVKTVALSDLVLETDAPFLPPQPMRGKQNNPASTAFVADFIATLRMCPLTDVADTTTARARAIFNLNNHHLIV